MTKVFFLLFSTHYCSTEDVHHREIMADADLLFEKRPDEYRITWQGHDFLAFIQDGGIWAKTKKEVAGSGGRFVFKLVQSLAEAFVEEKIEDHTGLKL